ncbi:hypothetical protein OKW30_006241 [Paraburkholderia sp. Clong3]|uniref:hypothetical protein n=1 Tax=Paraburkholderia sp. Clong3 TaxID=2991061 RepID=UPI003D21E0BE
MLNIKFLLAADTWPCVPRRVSCVNRPRCSNAFRAALRGKVAGGVCRQPTIDPSKPTSSVGVLVRRFFYFYDARCRLAVSAISLQYSLRIIRSPFVWC